MKIVNVIAIAVIGVCAVVVVKLASSPVGVDVAPPSTGSGAASTGSGAASAGSAGSASAMHSAPFEAVASAHVGDWRAFRITNKSAGSGERHVTSIDEVIAVTADDVEVTTRGGIDGEPPSPVVDHIHMPRHGLMLEHYRGFAAAGWTTTDVVISDDVLAIDGRRFPCKKASFRAIDPALPDKLIRDEEWFSPDVPAGGEIAHHEVQAFRDYVFDDTAVLVGYGYGFGSGGGSALAWGTRPAF